MSLDLSAEASDRTVSRPGVASWLLAGILLLGALFRVPGYLYPLTLHYDEGAGVEASMCRFPPGGIYAHPTLGRYLLTIAEAPKCVVTLLKGGGLSNIVAEWESDPAPFLRVARVVSLLSGLGTVLFAFLLGRALGGAPVGLTAALLLAVSPMHVHLSSTLKQWSLATLLTLAVLYLGHIIATTPASRKQLVIFGVVIGLATATVYPLFLLGLPVLVMLLGRWRMQRAAVGSADWKKDIALVIAGAAVAHFVGNFSAILAPQKLLAAYAESKVFALAMSSSIEYGTNLKWYFGSLFDPQGLGVLVATAGFAGLLLASRRGAPTWVAMLSLTLAWLFAMPAAQPMMANRYTAPVGSIVIIGAAWLIVTVGRMLASSSAKLARFQPAAVLSVLAAVPCFLTTMVYERALRLPPTRELARRWIETHVPPGTEVLQSIRYISPVLLDCSLRPLLSEEAFSAHPCYEVEYVPETYEPHPSLVAEAMLAYVASSNAPYLIYTQSQPRGMRNRMGMQEWELDGLQKRYKLLATFHYDEFDVLTDDTATVNLEVYIFGLRAAQQGNAG